MEMPCIKYQLVYYIDSDTSSRKIRFGKLLGLSTTSRLEALIFPPSRYDILDLETSHVYTVSRSSIFQFREEAIEYRNSVYRERSFFFHQVLEMHISAS